MPPLQFPVSRIRPTEDVTEHAMHVVIDAVNDFEHAITDAVSVSRCLQLKERIAACVALLNEAGDRALTKADRL